MAHRLFLALAILLISGCASPPEIVIKREPIEVEVPVYVPAPVPDALRQPLIITDQQLPVFIAPQNPKASSCLAQDDEQRLRFLLVTLSGRVKEWEAYGL